MALQTITTIKIGETIIKNFSHLQVNQQIHDHHTFSIEVRHDVLVSEFQSVMPISQTLIGEKISIEIKAMPGLDDIMIISNPNDYVMQFYGVVTKVNMRKSRFLEMEETIMLEGYSESIIMDSGPESHSFTKMGMAAIVNKVKADYDIDIDVNPFNTDALAYTVQYNESDFDFLNRLAMRYGQWFYFNGRIMVFGNPGSVGGIPKLVYGVNMQDFSYDIKLMPTLFKVIENDNRKGDSSINDTLKYRSEVDGFHQNFINKSNKVFNKETIIQLNQNPAGGQGVTASQEYARNKMRSAMADMMQIEASSEVPGITLGNMVRIDGVDIQMESSYTVTQITHTCDDGGGYENRFTAVNLGGASFSPRTNPDLIPHCESQIGTVVSNNDPDGLGGLKVKMSWQEEKGETTPFIPMVQPHGGGDKGFYFIPEVGEKVFVDFQAGNAEMPVIVGTISNSAAKTTYHTPNNDIKGIRTRSGIETLSNDAKGSWKVSTPDGNSIELDGSGNIINTAVVDMTIGVGATKEAPPQTKLTMHNDGKIVMDAKDTYELTAVTSITLKVGESSITMTPAEINITSTNIVVNGTNITIKGTTKTEINGSGDAKAVFNDTTVIDGSQVHIK